MHVNINLIQTTIPMKSIYPIHKLVKEHTVKRPNEILLYDIDTQQGFHGIYNHQQVKHSIHDCNQLNKKQTFNKTKQSIVQTESPNNQNVNISSSLA